MRLTKQTKLATSFKQLAILFVALVSTSLPITTWPGNILVPKTPLFLQNTVQPNIFFMVDDSGSMRHEVLKSSDAVNSFPSTPATGSLDFINPDETERLELCYPYNVMAYNPNVTYTPWKGYDDAGNAYGPAYVSETTPNFTAVRNYAYSAGGTTEDLTTHTYAYFPWNDAGTVGTLDFTDTNGDGNWDAGELTECGSDSLTNGVSFASLSLAQKKNYANWYTYYRTRDYVMKAALGEVIFTSQARVGLSTLWMASGNRPASNVGIKIKDVDNYTVPINATADANKRALFDKIGQIQTGNTTPLRTKLEDVGEYYRGTGNSALFGTNQTHTGTISSRSPVLDATNGGECQQNFAILMTDGFWNGGNPSVGNADGDGNTAFDGGIYADTHSNTLADVAMEYYENDMFTGLANRVPTIAGVDENDAQHMVTYTVAFGLKGQIRETFTGTEPDASDPTWPGWPSPFSGATDKTRIDDVWHAAFNGRGLYLDAGNPQELIKSFNDALNDIGSRTASAAGVSLTSGTISSSTRIYQTRFKSSDWSGQLLAKRVTGTGLSRAIVPALEFVGGTTDNAILAIEAQDWDSGRTILSYNGSRGIPFRWPSSPTSPGANEMSAAQVTDMVAGDITSGGTPDYALASQRVDYLRGDHSNEIVNGGGFRTRERDVLGCAAAPCAKVPFVLGDTVNSSPLYVATPPFAYPDYLEATTGSTNAYNDFKVAQQNRTPMIYFGANDGMLHGIDATTGNEKIAYVPSKLYNKLPDLTDRYYNHQFYVDESPQVADTFYNGAWHTNLVGALRGGGQGIFALDITDPSTFSESGSAPSNIVLWEFTDADDPDLGYTFGRPSVVKMRDGRWYAVIPNGYNNTENDGAATTSTTGNAVLYLIDIETKATVKIDTGVGMASSADGSTPNGLARPALIDWDFDHIIDYIYAGDLQGNMWKFDVTGSGPAQWRNAGNRSILFTAVDSTGVPQPITSRPGVDLAPAGPKGLFLVFGTGKYIEPSDITNSQTQSIYGVWDAAGYDSGAATVNVARNDLVTQTLTVSPLDPDLRLDTNNLITTWGNGGSPGEYMGWKIDLPETGERVIASPALQDNKVVLISITPSDSPCEPGGSSWFMAFRAANGGRTDDDIIDVNKDGELDYTDRGGGTDVISGVRKGSLILGKDIAISDNSNVTVPGASVDEVCASSGSSTVITSDSKGNTEAAGIGRPQKAFRQGWRQIQ